MSLFTFNINQVIDEETKKAILGIAKTQKKIMATLQEVTDALETLQATTDNVQALVGQKITELEAVIADLETQIANGATSADLQALLDKVTSIKDDLATTLPNA